MSETERIQQNRGNTECQKNRAGKSRSSLIIKGAHVFDFSTNDYRIADILVRDGVIERIGKLRQRHGLHTIDARGLFAVPGLIDVHVHLFGTGVTPRIDTMPPPLATAMVNCKHLLASGVTTVRSAGDYGESDIAINANRNTWSFLAPRIIASGKAFVPSQLAVCNRATLNQVLDDKVNAGAQWLKLKLWRKDGRLRPLLPWLQKRVRRKGLYSCCHAQVRWVDEVIAAGVNSIEHTFYLMRKTVARMRRSQFLVPTLAVSEGEGIKPTRWAWQMGKSIGVGSDAGVPGELFAGALLHEMEVLRDCLGLRPIEVFRLATLENARLLRSTNIGHLREGYLADILLLRKSVKDGLDALLNPCAVICNGQVMVGSLGRPGLLAF